MKNIFYTGVGITLSICVFIVFTPILILYFLFCKIQNVKKYNKKAKKNSLFEKDVIQYKRKRQIAP